MVYCLKMADIHLPADGGYSSWECTVIESSSGWLKIQAVCSDENYKKARDSGSKGLTAAASRPDLQRDLERFPQFCYWISLCKKKKKENL